MTVALAALVCRLDALIADQLDHVLHHAKLQALEASWRGLALLVQQLPESRCCRVRMIDVSLGELQRDFDAALDIEQSHLFSKVHDREFDHAGGEPFGVLLGNYVVDPRQPGTTRLLRLVGHIAAAAFAPFVCAVSPAFFATASFSQLTALNTLASLLQGNDYRLFNALRCHDNSRFVALVLPRILLRSPWPANRRAGWCYRERCEQQADLLWGNTAFALGVVLMREFNARGWFAHVRGVPHDLDGGGMVTVLPSPATADGDITFAPLPSVDAVISDTRERTLAAMGFASLCHAWNTPHAVFHNLPTLHAPTTASVGERATQLQNMLCACRIAHYLKCLLRDRTGSLLSAADCARFIERWLQQYAISSTDASHDEQARYPLRAFRVEVEDDIARPGRYRCQLWLTPHYQIDGISAEIRLTTDFTAASTQR